MPVVAYIANQFPSAVEPYVVEEIDELRRRGVEVITTSGKPVHIAALQPRHRELAQQTLVLHPPTPWLLLRALWICFVKIGTLFPLLQRIFLQSDETPRQRLHALAHTWLGACYALRLAGQGVQHIHAHHGYFASWVAMVAARLLGVSFSLTLHGSDLLVNGAYLDIKLRECVSCFTISEFNRQHLLAHYPEVNPSKIILRRLGVDIPSNPPPPPGLHARHNIALLAVGRLHPVKDHAFLIQACFLLKQRGLRVHCSIAGDGPEHGRLQRMISQLQLDEDVILFGHVERDRLASFYTAADVVALTSKSEGIPLVLMEAMAAGAIVLAPAITGIPELVIPGETGFLFTPGSLDDFVRQVERIHVALPDLKSMRHAALQHVSQQFGRAKNLEAFVNALLQQLTTSLEYSPHENPVLQQI